MTWLDRLAPVIKFTSPEGNVFDALWRGNARSMEKKLGIFEFPKVKGLKIQDLDVGGVSYPLTFYFEGPDNDQEENRFFNSCKERGLWVVIHPVLGLLSLQLVRVSSAIQPVTSGNVTEIQTEWLEPKESAVGASLPALAEVINEQAKNTNISSFSQFVNNITQDAENFAKELKTETNKLTAVITSGLKSLTDPVASLNASIASIQRSIQDVITQSTIDTTALGGQIQQLVQLPLLATTDIQQRLTAYSGMIANVFDLLPSGNSEENKNTVSLQEIALTSSLVALSQIGASGTLSTRSQVVETIDTISELFNNITNNLDNVQELFQTQTINKQYFSQTESFANSAFIISSVFQYLQLSSFDLAVERKFILEGPRNPAEIAITEYGGLGENDSNIDLFISSNKLQGNDILILPAGREVVIYG